MERKSVIFAIIVALLLIALIFYIMHPLNWTKSIKVSSDTLYVSSATLSGLATFGSVLGIKLGKTHESHKWNNIGMMIITISVVFLIILQGMIMLKACCMDFNLWELSVLQWGTMICLIGILLGFAAILEPSLNSQHSDPTKYSSPS